MSVSFRRAELEDADTVGFITSRSWQAAYRGIVPEDYLAGVTPEYRARKYRESYPLLEGVEFYLVFVDGSPSGAMNLHRCRDEGLTGCGEIGIFYFLPEYWGRGCATETMQFALERLKELGYGSVLLWVLEDNHRARRFYEKQGFVADGGRKMITRGKELADIRYRKAIEGPSP